MPHTSRVRNALRSRARQDRPDAPACRVRRAYHAPRTAGRRPRNALSVGPAHPPVRGMQGARNYHEMKARSVNEPVPVSLFERRGSLAQSPLTIERRFQQNRRNYCVTTVMPCTSAVAAMSASAPTADPVHGVVRIVARPQYRPAARDPRTPAGHAHRATPAEAHLGPCPGVRFARRRSPAP